MLVFLKDILKTWIGIILMLVAAFGLGTGAGLIFCWYYSIPLIFSFLGGILVLGIALAIVFIFIIDQG